MKHLQSVTIKKIDVKDLTTDMVPGLMRVEEVFVGTEMEWEEKQYMLENTVSCFFAYENSDCALMPQIIGEAYAIDQLEEEEGDAEDKADDEHFFGILERCKKENGAYIYSLGIVPEWEGMDISKRLLMNLLIELKAKGYKKAFIHSKEGASSHLAQFFGGMFIEKRANWYQTGKTYLLYEIPLTSFLMLNVQPYKQETDYDCDDACLDAMFDVMGWGTETINHPKTSIPGDGATPHMIMSALVAAGFKPTSLNSVVQLFMALEKNRPSMILTISPGYYEGHYMVVMGHSATDVYVLDVFLGRIGRMSFEELERVWWNNISKDKFGITF